MKCPNCGADVPLDSGWVSWCDQCEWGVGAETGQRAATGRRSAREERLANRLGTRMFADLAARRDLRPSGFSLSRVAACAVAVAVHLVSVAVLIAGLVVIVGGWPSSV